MEEELTIPNFLKQMLESQYGEEISKRIVHGYLCNRKVTLRVNTIKSNLEEVESALKLANIEFEKVIWSKEALVIKNAKEADIQKLKIYEEGKIYLQSLSSMLPPIILEPKQGKDILDMAAAPGGKTTQMAALSENKAHITACEMNSIRVKRLEYNIKKQGATCVYIMQTDSRRIDDFFSFDQILLDAPCSGSGTLNIRDENLSKTFTTKLIEKSILVQTAMLKKAIKILKPGSELVYSTCSILQCENEEILEKAMQGTKTEIVPIEFLGLEEIPSLPVKINGTLCVAPNELYEGFFVAKLRKNK